MRTARRRFALLATALLTASLVACGSSTTGSAASPSSAAAGFPATVTTGATQVTIQHRPTSIVSLSATATEMLYAIGAGNQVKAVDEYSDYPSNTPRTKLSGLTPNVEAIIAKKPDLVIVDGDRAGLGKRLKDLSIPLMVLPAATQIADVYTEIDELGTATGHLQQARDENNQIRTQIDKIVASAPHEQQPLTYYYELEPDYYTVTSSTFVGQLLKLLGMKNIADGAKGAAAAGGYPQLSAEYIIKADPDYILLADTICCHASTASVTSRPGWSGVTAVKKQQIVPLNDDIASRWGPRIVDLLRTVADALGKRS